MNDDCIPWPKSRDMRGYGQLTRNKKVIRAHRYTWEQVNGPIPEGLWVLHTCDNRACVNPEHLWLGTRQDNIDDMVAKGRHANQLKTHCPHGHPYDDENTVINHRGARECRTCSRASKAAWRARQAKEKP